MTTVSELIALAQSRLGTSFDFGLLYNIVEAQMQAVERAAGAATAVETFVHCGTLPSIISVLRPFQQRDRGHRALEPRRRSARAGRRRFPAAG